MTEKLVISVDGSKEHPDLLTVQDVFTHVLELFQLVNESDPGSNEQVRWKLVSASMNSPFTVVAEAIPARPGADIGQIAKLQKRAFHRNYAELQRGRIPSAWAGTKTRETVTRVLARNRNGIGTTTIDEGGGYTPVVITREEAERVVEAVVAEQIAPRRTKEQVGSIEGKLVEVSTYHGKPAIKLIERKTGAEVWCLVPEAFQHEIAEHTSIEDVWRGRRVVVRGRIMYGLDGKISRVEAASVRLVEARSISEEQITDKDFTGGLTVTEYLERLRDGSLG
jgi:hypothetical protein